MRIILMIIFGLTITILSGQSIEGSTVTPFPMAHYRGIVYQPILLGDSFSPLASKPYYASLKTQDHLPGFFCKMEYKLESKSKLAPRFRLGSLNYTNWMEGKGELYSRYWK